MKKYYYEDLNATQEDIATFDLSMFNFDGEDENGYYWTNKESFEWWQNIQEKMQDGTFSGDISDYN